MKKILLLFILLSISNAQISNAKNGYGLNVGERGVGLMYHRNIKSFDNFKIGATLRWLDIRLAEEIPVWDRYSQRYISNDKISLAIFPLFVNTDYYPFEGKIANNFSPFVSVKLGSVLVLDGDETIDSFFKRWSNAEPTLTYGGNIAIGVEFRRPGGYYYSFEFSYDMINLNETIDGLTNLNGAVLSFSIHR